MIMWKWIKHRCFIRNSNTRKCKSFKAAAHSTSEPYQLQFLQVFEALLTRNDTPRGIPGTLLAWLRTKHAATWEGRHCRIWWISSNSTPPFFYLLSLSLSLSLTYTHIHTHTLRPDIRLTPVVVSRLPILRASLTLADVTLRPFSFS